jgi:hypothetical protein
MDLSADPWAGRDPRTPNVDQAAMAKRYGPHWQAGVPGPHSNVWRDALRDAFADRTARWNPKFEDWDGIPIGREVNDAMFSQDRRVLQGTGQGTAKVTVTAPSGGELQPGQQVTVEWETSGSSVSSHTVSLSLDDGPFNKLSDLPKAARSFTFELPSEPSPSRGVVQVVAKDRSRRQVAEGTSQPFTIKQPSTEEPPPNGIEVPADVKGTLGILTGASGPFNVGPGRAARIKRLAEWVNGLGVEVPADVRETLRILTGASGTFVIGPGRAARIQRLAEWVAGLEKPAG